MIRDTMLTIAAVAAVLSVSDDIVLDHIRHGRLRAVNVGRGEKKARWRIPPEALEEFALMRTATARRPASNRRRQAATAATEYF